MHAYNAYANLDQVDKRDGESRASMSEREKMRENESRHLIK